MKETEIQVGDNVLIRNVCERGGTGKLRSYWESSIFEVIKKDENLPVYTMKNLHKGCDKRIMHRNLLMKCNDLPVDLFQERCKERKKKKKLEHTVEENSDDESSDNEIVIVYPEADPIITGGNMVVEDEGLEEEGTTIGDNQSEDAKAADFIGELFGESENEDEFFGFDENEVEEREVDEGEYATLNEQMLDVEHEVTDGKVSPEIRNVSTQENDARNRYLHTQVGDNKRKLKK